MIHPRALFLTLALALLVVLVACVTQCPDPCPEPSFGGTANLDTLALSGDLSVGDDVTVTDDMTVDAITASGLASLNAGIAVDTSAFTVADSTGNTVIAGTTDLQGNVSDSGGVLTIADNVLIDGQADAYQLTIQEYTTPTNAALRIEDSAGTAVTTFRVAAASAGSFDFINIADTLPILDGSDAVIGLDLALTGANHTGAGNTIYGIDLDLITPDAQADEIAIEMSDTDWDTGIKTAYDLEHIGLPTMSDQAVTYQSSGALWTVADGEIWYVHTVFCHITTNFDCTGDDCTLDIGDGGDQDGLLDLDDAELQTADIEGVGAPAGWQGIMGNATRGAYFAEGIGFLYAPSGAAETLDITIGGTDPAAGAGTCYLIYTRME